MLIVKRLIQLTHQDPMCRRATSCVLLGTDPAAWDNWSPLPPPRWFADQLSIFTDAAQRAAQGDRRGATALLRTLRSDEMRQWFDEHGQSSGGHRSRHYQIKPPAFSPGDFDVVRSPARYELEVFERDSYTCRYCGLWLLSKEVLIAFERAVGVGEFRTQGTNKQQHGVIHAFRIVADHAVPYKRGGRTQPDNLVSACPGCNYGKDAYTVEQMGVDDPFSRLPTGSDSDGLTSLIAGLRHHALITGVPTPITE